MSLNYSIFTIFLPSFDGSGYKGKVKCIYIDPPYNTGNDFVYDDSFELDIKKYLIETGEIDEETGEQMADYIQKDDGKKHSKWLSFMYPRLMVAKELLREDGVIFVSIDDNEVHNLRQLMNEVFGEGLVETFVWRKSGIGRDGKMKNTTTFRNDHEYIFVAHKDTKELNKSFEKPNFENKGSNPDSDPRGNWMSGSISRTEEASKQNHSNYYTVISPTGVSFTRQFDVSKEEFEKLNKDIANPY